MTQDQQNNPVPIQKTEEEWRKELTPEQYAVLREKGTEAPFSGHLLNETKDGTYTCVACGNPLFPSTAKFSSDDQPGLAGWPSFEQALEGSVKYIEDNTYGMHRTEVVCARCGSHLGHIFDDHTTTTGKHFCINSVCLGLDPENKA